MKKSVEDTMLENAAKAFAKDIDKNIMDTVESNGLKRKGWTVSKIEAPKWPFDKPSWNTDTAAWCHIHCSGDYRLVGGKWHFQRAEDATMFALVWA